ncbi:hypothetical protein [Antarctobacter heliothermus]|uniref:Uncharacterized protein n=1 Tax=Antarctobacter heliothermus TaxID=74033 RepID=A0A239GF94_9RHOB|nr:hypothetical protein [Antarctobacter heliothermus]SNS66744.1 hypothetical protein SAMN04488078_102547 [Antarctobacter heliothermus]
MAFLPIQSRPTTAAPAFLSGLTAILRDALVRAVSRPRKTPQDILAAQARRAEARAAADRLLC